MFHWNVVISMLVQWFHSNLWPPFFFWPLPTRSNRESIWSSLTRVNILLQTFDFITRVNPLCLASNIMSTIFNYSKLTIIEGHYSSKHQQKQASSWLMGKLNMRKSLRPCQVSPLLLMSHPAYTTHAATTVPRVVKSHGKRLLQIQKTRPYTIACSVASLQILTKKIGGN